MEAEVQKFERTITKDGSGRVVTTGERSLGTKKFEFGAPDSEMTKVIGGGYLSAHNPDFLQRELGKDGTCARFYFDRRFMVDIGDPESALSKKKRKLLFRNGFGYLCIPESFEKNEGKLKELYQAAIREYYQYEKLHPRPAAVQETIVTDEHGNIRRALLTAMDIKVGGGVSGNVETQTRQLEHAQKLSKKAIRELKIRSRLHRKIRESLQSGKPLRNPFIGPNKKRLYNIEYSK